MNSIPFPNSSQLPPRPCGSASYETLCSRYTYGGRKGRRAERLLKKAGWFHLIDQYMANVVAVCREHNSQE